MRLWRSTQHSLAGLSHALRTERAVQMEAVCLVALVPVALIVGVDLWQKAVLIGSCFAVIAVELLNTCVEKLCDHVTPVLHPEVKAVKDMGSAAVFCALIAAGLLWLSAVIGWLGVGG